ncbi:Nuclear actin-protein involved in chromatin remodeling [Clydaea vesicula]|uniref:Nuclear actin-protein involved in chromatin remodeling n=1 Tax=Clydaea vesicula TaxID=447962 RepID=A0AAD5XZJ4_9FUNG|nr:Nuclear actin-protein involved in chromatin remodeling [Clydaea vesicula]
MTNKLIVDYGSRYIRYNLPNSKEPLLLDNHSHQFEETMDLLLHPFTEAPSIMMTEPFCTPNHNRSVLNEMLFELYNIPRLSFGIDSLFSFDFNNNSKIDSGLVISSSFSSTHIIPVLNGTPMLLNARRLNWGLQDSIDYLTTQTRLKYPKINFSHHQAEKIMENFNKKNDNFYYSLDYFNDLKLIKENPMKYTFILQNPVKNTSINEISEKKRETGKLLQEMARERRIKKLEENKKELAALNKLLNLKLIDEYRFQNDLSKSGFKNENELLKIIKNMTEKIDLSTQKLFNPQAVEKKEEVVTKKYSALEIKELNEKREVLLEKIRVTKRLQLELKDKRSSASVKRMKSIALLSKDPNSNINENNSNAGMKRRRVTEKKKSKGEGGDDDFGLHDEDWAIYREIGNPDFEEEEEDYTLELEKIEAILKMEDVNFKPIIVDDRMVDSSNVVFKLAHSPNYDPESELTLNQMLFNIDRIRIPEIIFRPEIVGLDQMGLSELCQFILKNFEGDKKDLEKLTSNIFLTGSNFNYKYIEEKLIDSLKKNLHTDLNISVKTDMDFLNSGFRSMLNLSENENDAAFFTKEDYEEFGSSYFKESRFSNNYYQ